MKLIILKNFDVVSSYFNPLLCRWSVVIFLFSVMSAQAAALQKLHDHVPAVTSRLVSISRLEASNHLDLVIGLALRNREALTNLLRDIYNPASPQYRHYLTPAQFTERFGPSERDYQAVIAFVKANGLKVSETYSNRVLVDVNASVADIEKVFHLTMRVYPHPKESRTFYAPDTEPSLDLAVPISHISGLDNYSVQQPLVRSISFTNLQRVRPNFGSGPYGSYMGRDFRTAYVPGCPLDGSGQVVGMVEFEGYLASDIVYYENLAALPSVALTNVLLDGFNGIPTVKDNQTEVSLDIENVISMAPRVSRVIVYEAPNGSSWDDILHRIADDNQAKQISCSWSGGSPTGDDVFLQMEAQGQSFFQASGDLTAYEGGLIPFPMDNPYITVVGGTTLNTSGGFWTSESVWNWGVNPNILFGSEYVGSGGGISANYLIPWWQTNVNMTLNQGSTTMRNIPDVALTADMVYVRSGNSDDSVGGTSCAAPLWAGFTALVNQQAAATGKPTVGFINPAIYAIGEGTNYAACFHDITTGNNTNNISPTAFFAVPGYDLCTGWGTPNGTNLINALAPP